MKYKYKKIQMDAILVKQILDQTNTYNFIEDEWQMCSMAIYQMNGCFEIHNFF